MICEILRKYPAVEEAVLYASRSMGRFRKGSDIDLTLKFSIDPQTLNTISMELDDLMLPYMVDLRRQSMLPL
ncbi:nucleotidyltransferase domain-containing protein [Orrella marina]|uniref:nucleotidyltransferase domain-containing protein n=1 Tax=Orrella marina TaxID=2163011 RepID=UPI001D130DD6